MQTKECRHCKQPIHQDARRCQHCQGMQGWISDQKDPRMLAALFIPLIFILGIVMVMTRTITKLPERSDLAPESLTVKKVSYRFGSGPSSDKIFVAGEITNSSGVDAGKTCLRVNLLGSKDNVIDSFVQSMDASSIPAKGMIRFRLVAETPALKAEIMKASVTVERSRAKGRWD